MITKFSSDSRIPHLETRYAYNSPACYGIHSHPTVSMGIVTSGQTTAAVDNQLFNVSKGDIVMFNPEQAHACNPKQDCSWSYHMLYIDAVWWQEVSHLFTQQNLFHQPILRNVKLSIELCSLSNKLLSKSYSDPLEIEQEMIRWIQRFWTSYLEDCSQQRCEHDRLKPISSQSPPWIVDIKQHIEQSVCQILKLDELCEIAYLSKGQLIRQFKRHSGLSPYAYLQNHRINKAKELLKNGTSLLETAMDLGFSDQSHLNRVFKHHVATTPGIYASEFSHY